MLSPRHFRLGQLVGLIDEARVADAERPVPVVGHAVIAKPVHVIDVEPVVVNGEKVVAG